VRIVLSTSITSPIFVQASIITARTSAFYGNLYHLKADFGIKAECNVFATAHGKGPPDAVGGNSKSLMKV
jgi:hypothetical protein